MFVNANIWANLNQAYCGIVLYSQISHLTLFKPVLMGRLISYL